jgi:hypothetical protein
MKEMKGIDNFFDTLNRKRTGLNSLLQVLKDKNATISPTHKVLYDQVLSDNFKSKCRKLLTGTGGGKRKSTKKKRKFRSKRRHIKGGRPYGEDVIIVGIILGLAGMFVNYMSNIDPNIGFNPYAVEGDRLAPDGDTIIGVNGVPNLAATLWDKWEDSELGGV